ncbi:hypothetical protein CLOM_g9637 [Closterium sp. NIES-68]|nr:hypothetical protein CLOM_g9637 [Closterium sp. NIES-68]GJP57742.1 hypothetical protein CLOP_g17308 [Closterium sp. NIES-67]GJP83936.1 hypothetical protein CLOP_g14037 [Closterium sp. NIES-67]
MLHVVGLGLWDERDITVRGLEVVRRCQHVFLEAYTSVLLVDKDRLEALYGRPVQVADRDMVESRIGEVLQLAATEEVAFLVVGDPFGATTHTDLILRARQQGVAVSVVHNASVLNAVGATGLQLYRFGETVSIPFFTDTWQPDSFYDRILGNAQRELHTLCLLDIKVKEPSLEAMARGKIRYEPPRYMTVNTAIRQLLLVEGRRQQKAYTADSMCVGAARLGADSQRLVFGSMQQLRDVDFGAPLHSLVLCGALHDLERDFLEAFKVTDDTPRVVEDDTEGGAEDESERPIL